MSNTPQPFQQMDDSKYTTTDDERNISQTVTIDELLARRSAEVEELKRNEGMAILAARKEAVDEFSRMLRESIAPVLYRAVRFVPRWAEDYSPAGGPLRGHAEATFTVAGMTFVISRLGAWYLYGPYGYLRISHRDLMRPTLFILDALNEYPAWLQEHDRKRLEQGLSRRESGPDYDTSKETDPPF